MKISHFLLAAGLLSFSAALAQTTPSTTGPKGTASASQPVSGMPAPAANPKGAVSPGEVFTTGDPNGNRMHGTHAKRMKTKGTMDGSGKMKTKM